VTEPTLTFGKGEDAQRAAACHYAWTDSPATTTLSEPPSHQ
jgi:hypothetical protein